MALGSSNNPLQAFTSVVSAVAGIIGLLYIVGVVVFAGRLSLNRLPGESVLSQLPQPYLLAIGLSEVVLPTLLFGGIYLLLAWLAHGSALWSGKDQLSEARSWPDYFGWIGWSGALTFLSLLVAYSLSVQFNLAINPGWRGIFFLAVTLAIVGALGLHLFSNRYLDFRQWFEKNVMQRALSLLGRTPKPTGDSSADKREPRQPSRRTATFCTAAAVTLVALIVWVDNAIATPLEYVKVCEKTTAATGVLVAATSDTVYIGQYPSTRSVGNLDAINRSDVLATINGTGRAEVYGFVCPTSAGA